MGCPAQAELEQSIVFTICTHDPDTGVLTDADSAPSYRVYEMETGTAILTGTMAKLDDANTTGFYSEQIDCTTANGFEVNKAYNIYIQATVDSDTGGISYGFTVTNALAQAARTLDRIDFQRGHHTVTGSTFYVDGFGGNDSTGTGTRALPWKTISKALTAVTNNAHDEIILLPNSGGGPTTITEASTINIASKNYVQIRGPGRDVNVTLSGAGNVFNITSSGVELSGFRITTNSGTSNGVTVASSADFVSLYRLWITSSHQDGIHFNVANNCIVSDCVIIASVRDGVRVTSGAGSGQSNVIVDNVFRDAGGSAVNLQGSDASECRIQRNTIRDNAVGITVASGVNDTVISDNRMHNNTTQISDSGTRTFQAWNFLTSSTTGIVDANVLQSMDYGVMAYGTVTAGASTTSVPTSACTPAGAVANQFANRVMIFSNATTTSALRSVAATISASTNAAAPTFTVSTLPATPASGDTFVIV